MKAVKAELEVIKLSSNEDVICTSGGTEKPIETPGM